MSLRQDDAFSWAIEESSTAFEERATSESIVPAPEISFNCSICRKSFADKDQFDGHTSGVCSRRFKYSQCDKKFSSNTDLTRHLHMHTGVKLYQCEHQPCGKSFKQKCNLIQHTRVHTGERPFECNLPDCGKRFNRNNHLIEHKRLHTGEKPYHCEFPKCDKSFNVKGNLRSHERTHTKRVLFLNRLTGLNREYGNKSIPDKHKY